MGIWFELGIWIVAINIVMAILGGISNTRLFRKLARYIERRWMR